MIVDYYLDVYPIVVRNVDGDPTRIIIHHNECPTGVENAVNLASAGAFSLIEWDDLCRMGKDYQNDDILAYAYDVLGAGASGEVEDNIPQHVLFFASADDAVMCYLKHGGKNSLTRPQFGSK